MKSTNIHLSRFLAVSALALAAPLSALAAASADSPQVPGRPDCYMGDWGGHGHHRGHRDMGRDFGHGAPGMFMLRGLNLTDAQRTQLQKMMEEQRVALGDKMRAVQDTRTALHKLALSGDYTEQRASAMAATLAQQESDVARLMAEQGNKVYQLLTPEQRTQLQQRLADRATDGRRMPPPPPAPPAR